MKPLFLFVFYNVWPHKMEWQMWNIKERQPASKTWTFHVFRLSDMCAGILALGTGSESTSSGNISASVSKPTMKVIRKLKELFNWQSSMGAWHWTEKVCVSTQLERVVWEELLIASYSLREWHRDYPFLQYKATETGDFLYPVRSD